MTTIQLRMPDDLLEKIDQLRVKLSWHPNRSQVLRWLIENNMQMLAREAEQDTGTYPRRVKL